MPAHFAADAQACQRRERPINAQALSFPAANPSRSRLEVYYATAFLSQVDATNTEPDLPNEAIGHSNDGSTSTTNSPPSLASSGRKNSPPDPEKVAQEELLVNIVSSILLKAGGSLSVETIQNMVREFKKGVLYKTVVGYSHRAWHKFLEKYPAIFIIFLEDGNPNKVRVRHYLCHDWEEIDKKKMLLQKEREANWVNSLTYYLRQNNGKSSLLQFVQAYPSLPMNIPLVHPLPKAMGDITRFYKAFPEQFHLFEEQKRHTIITLKEPSRESTLLTLTDMEADHSVACAQKDFFET